MCVYMLCWVLCFLMFKYLCQFNLLYVWHVFVYRCLRVVCWCVFAFVLAVFFIFTVVLLFVLVCLSCCFLTSISFYWLWVCFIIQLGSEILMLVLLFLSVTCTYMYECCRYIVIHMQIVHIYLHLYIYINT